MGSDAARRNMLERARVLCEALLPEDYIVLVTNELQPCTQLSATERTDSVEKSLGRFCAPSFIQLLKADASGKHGHISATLILLYGESPATEGNIVELSRPLTIRTSRRLRRGICRG